MIKENGIVLSAVILTWNGEDVIKKNLESLKKQFKKNYELIVVDNNSSDKTVDIIKNYQKKFDHFKIIRNKKNVGFAEGNNIGIREAKGKYILLLNQDVEAIDKAISRMIDFLEKNLDFGAVAPQLLYPDGKIQVSCRPFYDWNFLIKELLTFGQSKKNVYNHRKSQEIDQPMASVLMIRGDLLKKLKGFDSQRDFWLYFNDVDLSYRIHEKGFKHYLLTEAKFYHHHGQSALKLNNLKRLYEFHRGLHRFFVKHQIKNLWSLQYIFFVILMIFSYLIMNIVKTFKAIFRR